MRNIFHYIAIGIAGLVLSSCNDDYLERYPLAELAPENYFRNAQELENYTNTFYDQLPDALAIHYNNPHRQMMKHATHYRTNFVAHASHPVAVVVGLGAPSVVLIFT